VSDCVDIQATLTEDEALAVLEPFFLASRSVFVEYGLERCKKTQLYCAKSMHDTARHFAACRDDGKVVLAAPEMAELDYSIVAAIFAHEMGHATDYLYPAEWSLDGDGMIVRRTREDVGDAQWARFVKAWEHRDDDLVEVTADAIAEMATGSRIGYLGPCCLQHFDRGSARPQGLR
jgi:hypothetical protein